MEFVGKMLNVKDLTSVMFEVSNVWIVEAWNDEPQTRNYFQL